MKPNNQSRRSLLQIFAASNTHYAYYITQVALTAQALEYAERFN